jgi:hypothetical protein
MNLLLSNFNNDNENDLHNLLINYQEYFEFKTNENNTNLYLNIDKLKNYIKEGKNIKYRKFIFLYLENIVNKKKFKNYTLTYDKIDNKSIQLIQHDKILDNYDIKNIKKLIYLIKYFSKKNSKMRNINIYKLDNELYADIQNMRFLNINFLEDYKYNFRGKGFIINNQSYLKNLIMIINCIYNYSKNSINLENINYSNKIEHNLINSKSNLIFSSKIKIELFISVIKSININVHYLEINNINSLKNLNNSHMIDNEYIFININILTNYFKNFDFYHGNSIIENINNSIIEDSMIETIESLKIKNIFMFRWNNIIIDNFNKIHKNDINYLKELKVNYYTYINYENEIDEFMLKNMSLFIINNNDLIKFEFNNYKYIIKNELLIQNKNEIENKTYNDELITIESNEESKILSQLNNNDIEIANILLNSNNKYIHRTNENNIENIVKKNKNNINDFIINKEYNHSSCCICMSKIESSEFCILECSHYFCKNCILKHKINEELNNNLSKCPICRYNYKMIYNIIHDNNEINSIIKKLENIIIKENNKKILIVSEYNEILNYLVDNLKTYELEYYKKKNNNNNIKISLINYLNNNIIKNMDVFIFFTFSEKGYLKYKEVRNLYNDYYLNKDKIKFYIFRYKNDI